MNKLMLFGKALNQFGNDALMILFHRTPKINANTVQGAIEAVEESKITNPSDKADGQVLTYDATNDEWVAEDSKGGSQFIGTQAEWDSLTDAEKEAFDGQLVSITDDYVDTEYIQKELDKLNDEKANQTDVYGSSEYNASTSYTVGQLCIHNGKLWRCKVACSGVEPTEGTYWTNESLKTLKAKIDGLLRWKIGIDLTLITTTSQTKTITTDSFSEILIEIGQKNGGQMYGCMTQVLENNGYTPIIMLESVSNGSGSVIGKNVYVVLNSDKTIGFRAGTVSNSNLAIRVFYR